MQCCRIRACHQYAYSVFPPSPSSNRSLNFSLPRASSSISLSRCHPYFCTILESWSLFLPALVSQCCLRPAFIFTIWGCTLWVKEDFWLDCTYRGVTRLSRAWLSQRVHVLDDRVVNQRKSLVQVSKSLTLYWRWDALPQIAMLLLTASPLSDYSQFLGSLKLRKN